ncbi:MAG TPA: alpha/beta fold hydrolase [Candidatus Dormibacteraeota bacterium]|nr:alpha/beta fold hydrolase [Candidatus Dormibacteraeota bacterium]
MKHQVVCIPGSVAPAAQRYRPLIEKVGDAADFHLKDLEVYREPTPPASYSIEEELDAIDRFVDASRLDRFHLVGYSGGGFISLAYAGTRPQRLLSLAVFEPARIPGELSQEERRFFAGLEQKLSGLHGDAFMSMFIREQVKPGAVLPPPPQGPVSVEMQKRPAGIGALIKAFNEYSFDRALLRAVRFPVTYAYGDLSHEEQAVKPGVLAQLLADVHVKRYAGIHHFVPPEMIYTADYANLLLNHWRSAELSFAELPQK